MLISKKFTEMWRRQEAAWRNWKVSFLFEFLDPMLKALEHVFRKAAQKNEPTRSGIILPSDEDISYSGDSRYERNSRCIISARWAFATSSETEKFSALGSGAMEYEKQQKFFFPTGEVLKRFTEKYSQFL